MSENIFVNFTEFAAIAKVSKVAISKAVESGRISRAVKPRGKRIMLHRRIAEFEYLEIGEQPTEQELAEVAAPWPDGKQSTGARPESDNENGGIVDTAGNQPKVTSRLTETRIIKEDFAGKIKEIEYETLVGKRIPTDLVELERYKHGREIRDAINNIPVRITDAICAELNVEVDKHRVFGIIEDELEIILNSIAANADKPITRGTPATSKSTQ